tara:strand:- start:350 stop:601 length:252 start_codon:yes stop_codon:yes gene_type:complete
MIYLKNLFNKTINKIMKKFSESEKSEIIELALSDHASFNNIRSIYGIGEKDVKKLMRENLKSRSYKSWRKRVREFSDRREKYK